MFTLKIDLVSVQPGMFKGFLTESIVARAVKKGLCEVNVVDLRDFGVGRWRKDGRTSCVVVVDVSDDAGRDVAQFVGTGFKVKG